MLEEKEEIENALRETIRKLNYDLKESVALNDIEQVSNLERLMLIYVSRKTFLPNCILPKRSYCGYKMMRKLSSHSLRKRLKF